MINLPPYFSGCPINPGCPWFDGICPWSNSICQLALLGVIKSDYVNVKNILCSSSGDTLQQVKETEHGTDVKA
jgi:hypothetical protein